MLPIIDNIKCKNCPYPERQIRHLVEQEICACENRYVIEFDLETNIRTLENYCAWDRNIKPYTFSSDLNKLARNKYQEIKEFMQKINKNILEQIASAYFNYQKPFYNGIRIFGATCCNGAYSCHYDPDFHYGEGCEYAKNHDLRLTVLQLEIIPAIVIPVYKLQIVLEHSIYSCPLPLDKHIWDSV